MDPFVPYGPYKILTVGIKKKKISKYINRIVFVRSQSLHTRREKEKKR